MQKLLTSLVLMFTLTLFVSSCRENEIIQEVQDELSIQVFEKNNNSTARSEDYLDEFSFIYKLEGKNKYLKMITHIDNQILKSILEVKIDNNEWVKISEVNVDISRKNHKLDINTTIEKLAKSVKNKYSVGIISEYEQALSQIPELLFNKLGRDKYFRNTVLSVFYHASIFKSAERAYATNSDNCHCGTFDSYTNDESPFFCSEDKIVKKADVLALINNKINGFNFNNKIFTPKKTLDYLISYQKEYLSASEVDLILRKEFQDFLEKKLTKDDRKDILKLKSSEVPPNDTNILPIVDQVYCSLFVTDGRDCGCCGNYSGPCFLCSLACYLHDASCTKCDWWCGWGCVEGDCN